MAQIARPLSRLRSWLGIFRSLLIYYGIPGWNQRLSNFYAPFIGEGELCFDIGAHVGSRVRGWRRLGARVVAVEPQPQCMRLLERWFGDDPCVTLVQAAVGAEAGRATLHVSSAHPTVSTLSTSWISAVRKDRGFQGVHWDTCLEVPVVTLDELITQYGKPAFCKLDVEGYELPALQGLSTPLRAVSFELTPASAETGVRCMARLMELGSYLFNWSVGESHRLAVADWLSASEMERYLLQRRRSGDVYARLEMAVDQKLLNASPDR